MNITYEVITNNVNYVEAWICRNPQDLMFYIKHRVYVLSQLRTDYAADFIGFSSANRDRGRIYRLKDKQLEDGLNIYIFNEQAKLRKIIIDKHIYDPKADQQSLRVFIRALTGYLGELDIVVMAHWLWQVKRRALRLPTKHELMPILVGTQGGGKSRAVQALISSWGEFTTDVRLTELSDSKNFAAFCKYLIAFADELEGADRTDMDSLKNILTTTHLSHRVLYTSDRVKEQLLCSFIGASNRKIDDVFYDSSGMRRFYEIRCAKKVDWDEINRIDYVSLWKAIDENNAEGYITPEMMKELKATQETYVNKSIFERFLYENNIIPTDEQTVPVSIKALYNAFKDFTNETGSTSRGEDKFFKALRDQLKHYEEENSKGKRIIYFHINAKSALAPQMSVQKASGVLEFKK